MFLITTIINKDAIVVFITLAVGFGGMAWAAFGVNQLDIGSGVIKLNQKIKNKIFFLLFWHSSMLIL